jgi:hypothetical protein
MAQSALPYPSNPSLEQLKVLATDSVIYLAPSGNDGTGDGSLAKPYRTLQKCMDVARTYTIVGSATLYIRFLRGEYTITQNVDLYHPQGGNLIIEGDPAAFQQRYLWQVEGYSWNIENFAGGGHTGNIRLFDGGTATVGGVTMHGFTSADQGMYFTITNASTGSRSGYVSTINNSSASNTGINNTLQDASAYTTEFAGDRFFNHGISHEDGAGILGIGRIRGATTSTAVLGVEFSNLNIDTRCPGLTWGGGNAGINNTITWGGINNNYPEPQYSQPNGYYGPLATTQSGSAPWRSSAQNTVLYPANPGVSHNTTDPYILSTYPVVIRANYLGNIGSLFLKNGTLKALRNIFFAANFMPFVGSSGTTGATLNTTQGLVSIDSNTYLSSNGTGLYLENSKIGIRHLGFYGMAVAVSAFNSTITSYFDTTGDVTGSASIAGRFYALENSLDNSPIICTTQVLKAILAKNSFIDFTDGSVLNYEYYANYRQNTSYISTIGTGVDITGTQMRATSLTINSTSDIPKMFSRIVVPVFPGMTAATGVTTSFNAWGGANVWTKNPVVKMFMHPSGGSEVEIGYVSYWAKDATTWTDSLGTSLFGSTAGASRVGTNDVSTYDRFQFIGIKTAPHGLSYMTMEDIRYGITAGLGGTFSIRFYGDRAAAGLCASYIIGKTSVLVTGANGVTMGYTNMANGNNLSGSAAAHFQILYSYGLNTWQAQGDLSQGAIRVRDGSSFQIEKSLVINNGGHSPIDVRRNSSIIVGDSRVGYPALQAVAVYNLYYGIPEGFPGAGNLSITGFSGKAIRISENSSATIGSLFVKHPFHADTSAGINNAKSATPLVLVDKLSNAIFGRVYAVTHPAGKLVSDSSITPLWTSITGVKYGSHYQAAGATESFFVANSGSNIFLLNAQGWFAFDGGTADMRVLSVPPAPITSTQNYSVFGSHSGSLIVSQGSLASSDPEAATSNIRTLNDTRAGNAQKIMSRSPSSTNNRYLYGWNGSPTDNRTWGGSQGGAEHNYTASATNVGVDGVVPVKPAGGITYSVVTTKGGRITN